MKYNDSAPYYNGYSAQINGSPYDSSPYIFGSFARSDWCKGWRDAENDSRKRLSSNETDNTNQQFESLGSKPVEVWSGVGLPPVGCECEVKRAMDWMKCKILFISEHHVVLKSNEEICWQTQSCQFRPMRTEAERKREEACSAIKSIIVDFDLESVENRGDEMDIAKEIFFSIRAGKIPHIKLEADDE